MGKKTQEPSEPGKARITVYVSKEVDDELRALLDTLPRSVNLSTFAESAFRRELERVKREQGLKK